MRLYTFKNKLTDTQMMKIQKIKADKIRNRGFIPCVDGDGYVTYSQKQNSFRLNVRSSTDSLEDS